MDLVAAIDRADFGVMARGELIVENNVGILCPAND